MCVARHVILLTFPGDWGNNESVYGNWMSSTALKIALVKATNLRLMWFFYFECFIDFTSGHSEVLEKAKITGKEWGVSKQGEGKQIKHQYCRIWFLIRDLFISHRCQILRATGLNQKLSGTQIRQALISATLVVWRIEITVFTLKLFPFSIGLYNKYLVCCR